MKKLKIFLIVFLTLLSCAFLLDTFYLKAKSIATNDKLHVLGSQIRTEDPVALRFVGTIDNYIPPSHSKISKYGMIIAYGKTNDKINFIKGGVINNYNVLCGEFTDIPYKSPFYVNLIGIPESDYTENFSCRTYIILDNGDIMYSDEIITRSLLSVAVKAKYNNFNNEHIDNILAYADLHYKKLYFNSENHYCIDNPIYEYDYKNLKEIFIDDYNRMFNTNIKDIYELFDISTSEFKNNQTMEEVFNTNIYRFFNGNNRVMYNKYKFILDFFKNEENIYNGFLNTNIAIIEGNSKQYETWYGGCYLVGYIIGFFTRTRYMFHGIATIDFSTVENKKFYDILKSEKIITNRDLSSMDIMLRDKQIHLPYPPIDIPNKEFVRYKLGTNNFNANDVYTITRTNATFIPEYIDK